MGMLMEDSQNREAVPGDFIRVINGNKKGVTRIKRAIEYLCDSDLGDWARIKEYFTENGQKLYRNDFILLKFIKGDFTENKKY